MNSVVLLTHLKLKPKPELNDARLFRALNLSKERARRVTIWGIEANLVERIEYLGSKG
jgi:hypothetical protein